MNAERVAEVAGAHLADILVARGEVVAVVEADALLDTLAWLRDEPSLQLSFLSSLTATDWPEATPRFWLAYDLRSIELHHRLRLKVGVDGDEPHAPTVTGLFPTADWHEREVFDFFGIVFDGHPNLTRMMMPDDWDGHPLRKTEELGGVPTQFHGALVPPVDERGMP